MTFLATFLDLMPMAIGLGKGSEANVPLARAVVGGLLTSTFLTLIVVPILYTLLIREPTPAEAAAEERINAELEDRSDDKILGIDEEASAASLIESLPHPADGTRPV